MANTEYKFRKKAYKKAFKKNGKPFKGLSVLTGIIAGIMLPASIIVSMFDNTIAIATGDQFWKLVNPDENAQYFTSDFASVEEMIAEECDYYVRYSDDMIICHDELDKAKAILERELPKYGVSLHPKKCEAHTANDWVTFLGFLIKGNQITLSKNRVKKLLKEIYKSTLAKPNITPRQAKLNIKRILYGDGDGYSWATASFGAMRNNKQDITILNNWIMDAIRLCEIRYNYNQERKAKGLKPRKIKYNMQDIGGIGIVTNLEDRTLIRGTGTKVSTVKERTQKEIDHYKSVGCLLKCYKIGRPIYEATVRGI